MMPRRRTGLLLSFIRGLLVIPLRIYSGVPPGFPRFLPKLILEFVSRFSFFSWNVFRSFFSVNIKTIFKPWKKIISRKELTLREKLVLNWLLEEFIKKLNEIVLQILLEKFCIKLLDDFQQERLGKFQNELLEEFKEEFLDESWKASPMKSWKHLQKECRKKLPKKSWKEFLEKFLKESRKKFFEDCRKDSESQKKSWRNPRTPEGIYTRQETQLLWFLIQIGRQ